MRFITQPFIPEGTGRNSPDDREVSGKTQLDKLIESVPVPDDINWLFMNLVDAKVLRYESLIDGTVNLWDVFILNQYVKYNRKVQKVINDYQNHQIAISNATQRFRKK